MQIKASIEIEAKPVQVFELYRVVADWASWDPEVVEASLPNGLTLGAEGWLKPNAGPRAAIQIIEVTEGLSFTVVSRLPLCRMLFGHRLAEIDGRTIATHWVEFSGPLSFLFRRVVGNAIQASLPRTMQGLKCACESRASTA